ncbi:MAG: inositol monophosphatase family protein [Candidatus Thermoplasmatota archaeon]
MDNESIKILAQNIVDKVHQTIKERHSDNFHSFKNNVGIGADGTPTKMVDKLAEDAAIDVIDKSDTDVNLLSEEAGFLDNRAEYTFVLDPIDGTRNAARGIPFYSVSLGVGKETLSDVEYGIIKNIPTGDIFIAERGYGAFLNNKNIGVPEVPEKTILSSLSLGVNHDEKTIRLAEKNKVRSLGSASLEMCMVATGALDFYMVGHDYLRVTDIAASTLIVREAGGVVTDSLGKKLDINLSLDERTSIVAAGNMELVSEIIS